MSENISYICLESVSIYSDLLLRTDPKIFSIKTTIQDHTLVPDKIVSDLLARCPSLNLEVQVEMSHLEVDDFVRKILNSETYEAISFLLQCSYEELTEGFRELVYCKVCLIYEFLT